MAGLMQPITLPKEGKAKMEVTQVLVCICKPMAAAAGILFSLLFSILQLVGAVQQQTDPMVVFLVEIPDKILHWARAEVEEGLTRMN